MARKLGLIAGSGHLPAMVVAACRANGRPLFVVALEGYADPAMVREVPHVWIRLGAAGTGIRWLREQGIVDLVLVGAVRRPGLFEMRPDLWTAGFLARVGMKSLGDDGLLKAVLRELEKEGFHVLGVEEILSSLLAIEGPYGALLPDALARGDIERGIAVVRGLGSLDVGQGAVVQQGIVLAVEAVEGTDAMLARCRDLAREGPGGVLVKLRKPGQERRVDLPTIGVRTVEQAATAGLRGIAVEAGGAIVVDAVEVARRADALGLFVIGIAPSAESPP
ncbi:MAG: LpxI family protein [Alphaproteobacteria bacterium]